jgi:hypothetical protein
VTRVSVLLPAWLGVALAALFFYPLAAALSGDNAFYLQWQHRDVWETVAAMAGLAAIIAAAMAAAWPRLTRGGTLAVAAIAAIPMASLAAGVVQELPFDAALVRAGDRPFVGYGVPALLLLLVVAAFVRWPVAFGQWLRRALLVASLVALVVLRTVIASAWYREPPVELERAATQGASGRCRSVVALLFDELSFAYLYDGASVRAEFPEIRRFSASATNYLAASSPAHETLVSMPAYLAARTFDDVKVEPEGLVAFTGGDVHAPFTARAADGLFATARRLGYRTEMAGYYLPYCDLLGSLVDRCQSLSFYNVSRVDRGFSPLHAIATTFVLWPRQFPFGLLKNRAFARLQRDLVARTAAFAMTPIGRSTPTFRFVHFSVPHLPFVFDEHGFDPPLDPLRTAPDDLYARQIRYVDRLVGQILAAMQRDGSYDDATVIVMSDHGFRFGGRERDPMHIPFIVKEPGQTARRDMDAPAPAVSLLPAVLAQNCR